jgi:maternal-effect protein exuperantia
LKIRNFHFSSSESTKDKQELRKMVAETKFKKLEGKYTIVGLDLDTTGRRLIDEVVHIAAYTPNDQFSQYIMPLMNLNPGARARHKIRVITVGFFRMLKSMVDYKVIKTKTEIATLMEFLAWLEKVNGNNSNGIIFVYHEQIKFVPYMMIEIMKKYNLWDRFGKIVKGFINGYDMIDDEVKAKSLKYLPLTDNLNLQKECINIPTNMNPDQIKESVDMEGKASHRAQLSYEICKYMAFEGQAKDLDEAAIEEQMHNYIRQKALPLDAELEELVEKEESLTRQGGMREIFINYFSTSRYHRRRAVNFRRALADVKHDKDTLQELYNKEKREGLENLVKSLESVKEEDREELIEILDSYFDEEKKPAKPPVNPNAVQNQRRDSVNNNGAGSGRNNNMRRRRGRNMNNNNNNNVGGNKENRGPRNDSRRRRSQRRNNSRRRFSGNGNVNLHDAEQKKQQSNMNNHPQMVAAGAN